MVDRGISWLCRFFSHSTLGKRVLDAIMAFVTMMTILVFWWFIVDINSPITKVERELVGIHDGIVYVGSDIHIKGTICSNRVVPVIRITRTFIDGLVYTLPPTSDGNRDIPNGCSEYRRTIHIPNNLPPGQYMQHTEVEVRINPLRTVVFESPNLRLTVKRPPNWVPGSDLDGH